MLQHWCDYTINKDHNDKFNGLAATRKIKEESSFILQETGENEFYTSRSEKSLELTEQKLSPQSTLKSRFERFKTDAVFRVGK